MKNKLRSANLPLPKFRSEKEAADYFDTRSVASVWNQLRETGTAKVSKALGESIRKRHKAAKAPISIRLAAERTGPAK